MRCIACGVFIVYTFRDTSESAGLARTRAVAFLATSAVSCTGGGHNGCTGARPVDRMYTPERKNEKITSAKRMYSGTLAPLKIQNEAVSARNGGLGVKTSNRAIYCIVIIDFLPSPPPPSRVSDP